MRELATVRRIERLEPILGADKIELAHIDGWECVVRKGIFCEGDPCVYFEIDAVLPATAKWAQFLRDRKFRVKTARFLKQRSQGLALPLSEVGLNETVLRLAGVGTDLTKELGVVKYDPEAVFGRGISRPLSLYKKDSFMFIKRVWDFITGKPSKQWPSFIPKAGEEWVQNIRNMPQLLKGCLALYSTEKLHGQSATYFLARKPGRLCKLLTVANLSEKCWDFGVCSRNLRIPSRKECSWWAVADKYEIEKALRLFCLTNNRSLAVQGDIIGPGICDNNYRRASYEFFVLSVYDLDAQRYLCLEEKQGVCSALGLSCAPLRRVVVVEELLKKEDPRGYLLSLADGPSVLCITRPGVLRKGLVFRSLLDDALSFKAISNRWLDKQK